MAQTTVGKKKSILQRTFNVWKSANDPHGVWLKGNPLFTGSKKIGQVTCIVCHMVKESRPLTCIRPNCCSEFVDGESKLLVKNIQKHAACESHVEALKYLEEKGGLASEKNEELRSRSETEKDEIDGLAMEKTEEDASEDEGKEDTEEAKEEIHASQQVVERGQDSGDSTNQEPVSTGQEQGSEKAEEPDLVQDLVSNHDGFQGGSQQTQGLENYAAQSLFPPKSKDKLEELNIGNEQNEASNQLPDQVEESENLNEEDQIVEMAGHQIQPSEEMRDQLQERGNSEKQVVAYDQDGKQVQNFNNQRGESTNVNSENGMVMVDCHAEVIQISRHTSISLQDGITLIATKLKRVYENMSYNLLLPWFQNRVVDLEIYLKMAVIDGTVFPEEGRGKPFSGTLDKLFEPFQYQKPSRIVLDSEDDILSSAALMYISRSWATDAIRNFGAFDLVIWLEGKKLANKSLDNVIVEACHIDGFEDFLLLETIKTNRYTLLMIDDLPPEDEIKPEFRESVKSIVRSKKYENQTVLLTSRTAAFSWRKDKNAYFVRGSNTTCTKYLYFDKIRKLADFITSQIPTCTNAPITNLRLGFKDYLPLGELQELVFYLLLLHTDSTYPRKARISVLITTYEKILLGDESTSFGDLDIHKIPPKLKLLSKVGEYILNTFANEDSELTYGDMEKNFQNDFGSVLNFGFAVVKLEQGNKVYAEELILTSQSLLETMIACHLWIVYKTQPMEEFLLKLDIVNTFQPLYEKSCTFLCEALAYFLKSDADEVYISVRRERLKYKMLLLVLNAKLKELDWN